MTSRFNLPKKRFGKYEQDFTHFDFVEPKTDFEKVELSVFLQQHFLDLVNSKEVREFKKSLMPYRRSSYEEAWNSYAKWFSEVIT